MSVLPDVESIIKGFHSSNKPIGFCCIAPILAAKVLPGVSVTLGKEESLHGRFPFHEATGVAKKLGAKHIPKDIDDVVVDHANKVVTSPAFMCDTAVHEIFDNVGQMVKAVLKLVKSQK